jgi:3-oxoacyl-[acyl-carrier protein] reductase
VSFDAVALTGRVALVTGAGSRDGIGFAAAHTLAARGARVAIAATTGRIHDRAAELGALGVVADLTDDDAARNLADDVQERLGPIDVLVNNAGMVQTGQPAEDRPFAELTMAEWERGIAINLHTTFRMCRLVAPGMAARGHGRIVNVSSVTGPYVALPSAAPTARRRPASTASRVRSRSSSRRAA